MILGKERKGRREKGKKGEKEDVKSNRKKDKQKTLHSPQTRPISPSFYKAELCPTICSINIS